MNKDSFNSDLNRRRFLARLALSGAALPLFNVTSTLGASKRGAVNSGDFGLSPNSDADQSAAMQRAVLAAASSGRPLFLDGGNYRCGNIELPSGITISGVAGATSISALPGGPVFSATGQSGVTLEGLALAGASGPADGRDGVLVFKSCQTLRLDGLTLIGGVANGVYLDAVSGRVSGLEISGCEGAGIFANNSQNLTLAQNTVSDCGNGGILVWRDTSGPDGTIVTGNTITRIGTRAGGNGQNGNGINIFRADGVIVANNRISSCAFSAIRANGTNNTQIRGNTCTDLQEVAIFSEFGFSGSLIADNIIDGAAAGISMTNFDTGGHLAVCSGNLVRNILGASPTNPDTTPFGIAAEADAVITGNTIDTVPGIGISVGYGPYLRDVLVSNNLIRGADTGIGVSVAKGAGTARIASNLITGARRAIVGLEWDKIASPDLARDAARYPQLAIKNNTVSG